MEDKPALYIPPEMWEHILSYLEPKQKICEKCKKKYCSHCSGNLHFECADCNKFVCKRDFCNYHNIQCQLCKGELCKECYTWDNISKNGVSYLRYGCKKCVTQMKKKIMESNYYR